MRKSVFTRRQFLRSTAIASTFPTIVAPHVLGRMLQRKLNFDPVRQEFVNDSEANGLRTRAARAWS